MSRRACHIAGLVATLLWSVQTLAADNPAALTQELGADSFERREAATQALVAAGKDALPALEAAATSKDPEVRWRAQMAIRLIRWNVSPELARKAGDVFAGYEDRKWFERERLVFDLPAVGDRAAMPTLGRLLADDPSDAVRRAAAIGLLGMGPDGLLAIEKHGAALVGLPADSPVLRIRIGNGFLEEGKFEQALREYDRALKIAPRDPVAWYNRACALSLLKRVKEAVESLVKAVESGYDDVEWMKKDSDLDNLREDEGYKALVERLEKAAERKKPEANDALPDGPPGF